MASKNKFEEMLERLVNEDQAGAEELFHEIVVEKSRDIYESLLESDIEIEEEDDEDTNEATDEEVDESDDEDDDEEVSEDFDLDEFEVEGGDMDMMGGDPSDMAADMGMDDDAADMDMDDEGEEEIEDRVEDLEDALDDLKAEFEAMMADGDEGDDEGDDMDDEDGDDEEAEEESIEFEAADEEVEEATDDDIEEGSKSEAEQMREYVEKISATMGDNGDNTKSPVAGKNDMGGNASNLNQGGDEKGMTPAKAAEDDAGNVNTPGSKNATKMSGEKAKSGDEAQNKKSTLGSK